MSLSLYGYPSCPYCARVLSAVKALDAPVEFRDVHVDPAYRAELLEARKVGTVPVLRIEEDGRDDWMGESEDIIALLYRRFGEGKVPPKFGALGFQRGVTGAMWLLLIAGMFVPEQQSPLWLAACVLGTIRSVYNGITTRAWTHFAIGGVFLFACVSIGMRAAGVAGFPWWYVAYGFIGLLVLAILVRRKHRGS